MAAKRQISFKVSPIVDEMIKFLKEEFGGSTTETQLMNVIVENCFYHNVKPRNLAFKNEVKEVINKCLNADELLPVAECILSILEIMVPQTGKSLEILFKEFVEAALADKIFDEENTNPASNVKTYITAIRDILKLENVQLIKELAKTYSEH